MEDKITTIDGVSRTKEELLRTNFLFIGGQFHGYTSAKVTGNLIEFLNTVEIKNKKNGRQNSKISFRKISGAFRCGAGKVWNYIRTKRPDIH